LAKHPNADRLVEPLACPPIRVKASRMPANLSGTANRLARLIAGIDQSLMHAARSRREKCKLSLIPESRVKEIDAPILLSSLSRAHRLPGKLEQALRVGCVVGHQKSSIISGSGSEMSAGVGVASSGVFVLRLPELFRLSACGGS